MHHPGEIQNGELLRELVEDTKFAPLRRVLTGDLDATNGVADVQKPARLSSRAVHRQGVADRCFRAEAVQGRTEDLVVIEAVDKSFIESGFVRHRSEEHTSEL